MDRDSKEALYSWYKRLMGEGTPMANERAATLAKANPGFASRLERELFT
jgi:hypothetical protein